MSVKNKLNISNQTKPQKLLLDYSKSFFFSIQKKKETLNYTSWQEPFHLYSLEDNNCDIWNPRPEKFSKKKKNQYFSFCHSKTSRSVLYLNFLIALKLTPLCFEF